MFPLLAELSQEFSVCEERVQSLFKDMSGEQDRLTSVLVHSGDCAGGHYWMYVLDDRDGRDSWIYLNDSRVEQGVANSVPPPFGGSLS